MARAKASSTPSASPANETSSAEGRFSKYKRSSIGNALSGDGIFFGAPGTGKTFLAASGSKFYPSSAEITERFRKNRVWANRGAVGDPPEHELVILHDMAWLGLDSTPLAGLAELGIVVPTLIDMQEVFHDMGVLSGCSALPKILEELLPESLTALVIDTASELDKRVNAAITSKWIEKINAGKAGFDRHLDFMRVMTAFAVNARDAAKARGGALYACAHAKAKQDPNFMADNSDSGAAIKNMAILNREARGNESINPSFTGQIGEMFKGHGNFQVVMSVEEPSKGADDPDDPTLPEWFANFRLDGWETKNRFKSIFRDREVPHIGELRARAAKLSASLDAAMDRA